MAPLPAGQPGNRGSSGDEYARSDLESRMAVLETRVEYLVEKAEMQEMKAELKAEIHALTVEMKTSIRDIKIWVLSGVFGSIVLAILVTIATVVRFLSLFPSP